MRFRLTDDDRQRLGVEQEWVEIDLSRLMMLEAEELEEAGYDADEFLEELRGEPVFRRGEPVMVDVLDEKDQPVIGADGKPEQRPMLRNTTRSIRAAVWIALRRAGTNVPFATFDFDMTGLRREVTPEPEGKDTSAPPDPASES